MEGLNKDLLLLFTFSKVSDATISINHVCLPVFKGMYVEVLFSVVANLRQT